MITATKSRTDHLREVHEHLRYAATSDSPEEIRERMRRVELALERHERELQKELNSLLDRDS